MEDNEYALITQKSLEYTDKLCRECDTEAFTRHDIAAAYQIGAIAAIARVRSIITEINTTGALTTAQAAKLLLTISAIESTPL